MGLVTNWLEGALGRVREFAYKVPDVSHWQRPRLGLALGGGFARGIAHIGILRVLEANNIPIDYIAGTSSGALIGAAYAAGCSLDDMQRMGASTRFKDFAEWTISLNGLASVRRLEAFLEKMTPVRDFKEMRIPLAIAATDLISGEPVYLTEGKVGPAVCASCAYPGLFRPVPHNGYLLVDGFVTATVPTEAARRMGAGFVVAVNLGIVTPTRVPRNVIEVVGRSFSIIQARADHVWRQTADLVIEPEVKGFVWDDFAKAAELVAAGEAAAHAALPRIRTALAAPSRPKFGSDEDYLGAGIT